jgi:hypothetical protein
MYQMLALFLRKFPIVNHPARCDIHNIFRISLKLLCDHPGHGQGEQKKSFSKINHILPGKHPGHDKNKREMQQVGSCTIGNGKGMSLLIKRKDNCKHDPLKAFL